MTESIPAPWPVLPFPDAVISVILIGALVLTGLGAVTLVVLLIKDKRKHQIW